MKLKKIEPEVLIFVEAWADMGCNCNVRFGGFGDDCLTCAARLLLIESNPETHFGLEKADGEG